MPAVELHTDLTPRSTWRVLILKGKDATTARFPLLYVSSQKNNIDQIIRGTCSLILKFKISLVPNTSEMRFLCLHGVGTNSQVRKTPSATQN